MDDNHHIHKLIDLIVFYFSQHKEEEESMKRGNLSSGENMVDRQHRSHGKLVK